MQEFVQEVGAKPAYGKSSVFSAKFMYFLLKYRRVHRARLSGLSLWPFFGVRSGPSHGLEARFLKALMVATVKFKGRHEFRKGFKGCSNLHHRKIYINDHQLTSNDPKSDSFRPTIQRWKLR